MAQQGEKLRLLRRIPDIRFEQESRGYSMDQVDRVLASLAPLADEIEKLQARLIEAETRAESAEARLIEARSPSGEAVSSDALSHFDETLRNTLVNAQRTADTLVAEARNEADKVRNEAENDSNGVLSDARSRAEGIATEAAGQRERILNEAAAEHASLLKAAQDEAQGHVTSVVDELARAHETERSRLLEQIRGLHHIEGLLKDDVARFERHLDGRYSDVRGALSLINDVVTTEDRLRTHDVLAPTEIGAVDTTDYPPITLKVAALDALQAEAHTAIETTTRPDQAIAAADLDDLAPIPVSDQDDLPGFGISQNDEVDQAPPPPQLDIPPRSAGRARKPPQS